MHHPPLSLAAPRRPLAGQLRHAQGSFRYGYLVEKDPQFGGVTSEMVTKLRYEDGRSYFILRLRRILITTSCAI
jgi:hypothetical protein